MSARPANVRSAAEALERVLDWSRARDYKGWSKHDALNSPLLAALLGWGRWPRILAIQAVMRAPVNIRPLLLVRKAYNPKGLALFAHGLLERHRATGRAEELAEAERLLSLLLELRSRGPWSGNAWGYHYPWQDLGFYAPTATPNAVVTSFVCEAFLEAWRTTGKAQYLDVVAGAVPFYLQDLTVLKDEADELCLAYMPLPMRMRVMDVSILIGAVLAQYAKLANRPELLPTAERLVRYVVNRQTDYHAWYYTDPPGDSPIRHDNYHTGFILDALWRYMQATGDTDHAGAYRAGLDFYARSHFAKNGAPRWMSDREYPHDIHGAAQGILTFARHRAEYPGLAAKVVAWSLVTMYDPEGRFYYQETRWYRKRFTEMRWCNAWMVRALSQYLLVEGEGT